MDDQITILLRSLYGAYSDNAQMWHYAEHRHGGIYSTMPTTSFVYNFFIYNSIYQYDWETSVRHRKLTLWSVEQESHDREKLSETVKSDSDLAKQKRLEKFMRKVCKKDQTLLPMAFRTLAQLTDLDDPWITEETESRPTRDANSNFFINLLQLSHAMRQAEETGDKVIKATKQNFELIQKCRYSVYTVRNNIFHGSKTLGDTRDQNHKKRLAYYDLFLKCLLQLFFLGNNMDPLPGSSLRLCLEDHRAKIPPPLDQN